MALMYSPCIYCKYWQRSFSIPNSCRESSVRQAPLIPCLTEQQNLYQSKQHFSRVTANLKAPSPPLYRAEAGFASQYSSASFYTGERCVCVRVCERESVCVVGFKALACLFPLRVTGVLMACQVSRETRDTGWVGFNNLSLSHLNGPLSLFHMVDVY